MSDQIVVKRITKNLVDVFFGETGFEAKEWCRFKKEGGVWVTTFNKKPTVNWIELECGYVVKQSSIIKQVQGILNEL